MTVDIKKILFATNLSKNSRHAFNYAVSAANKYGASITILHVMEDIPLSVNGELKSFLGEEMWLELQKSREQEARQILIQKNKEGAMIRKVLHELCEEAQKNVAQGKFVTDDIVVAKGNVVDNILDETQSRGCDLIVMGSNSRSRLGEALVGSTIRMVLRRSNIPVLIVRLPEEG